MTFAFSLLRKGKLVVSLGPSKWQGIIGIGTVSFKEVFQLYYCPTIYRGPTLLTSNPSMSFEGTLFGCKARLFGQIYDLGQIA